MQVDDDPERIAMWRVQALDEAIAGRAVRAPAQQAAWFAEALPPDLPPALGIGGVPSAWRDVLGWCGVPLAAGPLRWGVELSEAAVPAPEARGGRMLLPPRAVLKSLSGVALKPLRHFIAQRLGCRLQAGPGVRMWLWPGRAVLQSLSPLDLAGFCYGSPPGHRAGLALAPWGSQIVTW